MTKPDFWKRFDKTQPFQNDILDEIIPPEKIKHIIESGDTYSDMRPFYSIMASYFRDAVEYGYLMGYSDAQRGASNRYEPLQMFGFEGFGEERHDDHE